MLIKRTIQKQKEALNEQKALLNERLKAKKDAMNQEDKIEELSRLKQQLALIQADQSRTKDAKELAKKIADIEQDLAWQIADEQAAAESKAIDDQIKALDEYVATEQENLNERLSHYETFRDEVNQILSGTFEEFVYWMKQNNEEYKNASDEQRQQMEQGWEDTWHTMKHELQTYWDEVDAEMQSKDGFIQYMMGSDQYMSASAEKQKALIMSWENIYDKYTSSLIDDFGFTDIHEIVDKIDDLKDWTYSVRWANDDPFFQNLMDYYAAIGGAESKDLSTNFVDWYNEYKGVGKKDEPKKTTTSSSGGSSSSSSGNGSGATGYYAMVYGYKSDGDDFFAGSGWKGSADAAKSAALSSFKSKGGTAKQAGSLYKESSNGSFSSGGRKGTYISSFKTGGLVDYTGPAWVDGTKKKPEAFLDSTDTAILRAMLDEFTYIKSTPYMTHIDDSTFSKGGINVGDVNVNLYEARLENDADYDEVARRVGKAFTKELQKDGFNLAAYAW